LLNGDAARPVKPQAQCRRLQALQMPEKQWDLTLRIGAHGLN
jgi:hypothetical protein